MLFSKNYERNESKKRHYFWKKTKMIWKILPLNCTDRVKYKTKYKEKVRYFGGLHQNNELFWSE